MNDTLEGAFEKDQQAQRSHAAKLLLGSLIQPYQYAGEVYSIGYNTALVQIHDHYRGLIGGIPSLSFLVATRVRPGVPFDPLAEDSCVLLLRVMDAAALPNAAEADRIRVETGQRVTGEAEHWDDQVAMDAHTAHILSFAGVQCRVLGTFYLVESSKGNPDHAFDLRFGSDLSNFYPNRGLKVYKPNGDALRSIVNYRDSDRVTVGSEVRFAMVRYASTDRPNQEVGDVPVSLAPEDLLRQKTALFGMTRSGKSNTTKIIVKSVFDLRFQPDHGEPRVGQIVFDPNGEYANENVQDQGAIKNVWRTHDRGERTDVVTYGVLDHPLDPDRHLMRLNFFAPDNLQTGKEIIDAALAAEESQYIRHFRDVRFEAPPENDRSATTRFKRRVLAYRALLVAAGFEPPAGFAPDTDKLFGVDLIKAMRDANGDEAAEYHAAARVLGGGSPTWGALVTAFGRLYRFVTDRKSGYDNFNDEYMQKRSGDPWADEGLKKILIMFTYPYGPRLIGRVHNQHTERDVQDYAIDIYRHLCEGRLVIVDQSSGEPELNKASARRIMWEIFKRNQQMFRSGDVPHDVLIYVEEAHNLLPADSDQDLSDVWVRTAKEGAKYRLGMVYATQEVSSIQRNILKNTANWFIGHLNNTDETREVVKYYDFADFEASIRRAQDRGFVRVKTLSNLFVIPAQVLRFEAPAAEEQ